MSNNSCQTQEFSFLRGLLFPIHWHEMKRFVPMALMMLFILCNYTILRNLKDTIMVNAKGSGAEVISFLKLWGTMPSAFLFMVLYSKMTDWFSREKVFYLLLFPFLAFFGAFAFLIYPNTGILHPSVEVVDTLKQAYPNFKWFIVMWGNWSYVIFYVLAELWGSVMLSLLFWQFANDIVKKDQTKRFYPLFGMIANIGLIFAGFCVKYFSKVNPGVSDPWQQTLNALMPTVVIGGLLTALMFWIVSRQVDKEEKPVVVEVKEKKSKPKLSLGESFRYLASSPHLLCIAVIVLAYGVSMNYLDVLFKDQVKTLVNGDKNAYADAMGNFAVLTGVLAIPIMLVAGNLLRRISWRNAALITPLILVVAGFGFFSMIYLGNMSGNVHASLFEVGGFSVTFIWLGVQFGLFQNAVTKATKYSLFDSTKEMAYIPLDKDLKTKGKAAVDVVGGRLGKSGGALTFFIIQSIMPNMSLVNQIPFLAISTLLILAAWFLAVGRLDKSIKVLQGQPEEKAPVLANA